MARTDQRSAALRALRRGLILERARFIAMFAAVPVFVCVGCLVFAATSSSVWMIGSLVPMPFIVLGLGGAYRTGTRPGRGPGGRA